MSKRPFIPLSVPSIRGNEWKYVKECLDTEWVSTAGSYVNRFESDISDFVGAKHAIACATGTGGLQVALECAGVTGDDEVIVPTLTFIATINAVSYIGASPIFLDCDHFYNLSPDSLEQFLDTRTITKNGITRNKGSGRRIAAIVPVHVFGNAADLEAISSLVTGKGIPVIEDAAESLGTNYISGKYSGRHCGTVGLAGCISFNGNKIITTGGGGMIVTNDDAIATRARYLSTTAKDDEVRYVHDEVGYNYRLTNVQAAIGTAQLEQLPAYLEIKAENYRQFAAGIAEIPGLELPPTPPYASNNHWMYPVQIDTAIYRRDREQLMQHLQKSGIQSRPVWLLNHLQKPYLDCEKMPTPTAEELLARTLCIPCSTNLKVDDIEYICERLR